ncbi:hypothetical protein [uncultured Tenacibaculum sp.]|uniref:hypothetical protein n=1 Tax=uncultured Tenacibaculum sp. TaxID=174713 RepID=UPI00263100F0|nr:hypothetical protein [uncultured Tenacibaculum sp.]
MKSIKLITLVTFIIAFISCNNEKKKEEKKYTKVVDSYGYPTDSVTINKWVADNDLRSMYKHSWDVWKHLTTSVGHNKLRYQTWASPTQIINKLNNPTKNEKTETLFEKPHQFSHHNPEFVADDLSIVVTVGYNKASEKYAIDNKIFYLSSLKKMQTGPYSRIPDFPSDAINIKPVYKIITKDKVKDDIYTMSAWNGPKSYDDGYPQSKWKSCIHVNVKDKKNNPSGRLDYSCDSINANNTFYLDDFIHFKISAKQAASYNQQIKNPDTQAKEGDIALLVAMHVTTKEIKRWTWQTYWWSPTPLNPRNPSSNAIASSKNGIQLEGAATHYAMAVAYSMITPSQPYINGKNEGDPLIAFNPYLEAHFGRFGSDSYVMNNGNKIDTNLGVDSNCMSCHIVAAINIKGTTFNGPSYQGDMYTSYKDSVFTNRLMLDFAWSIQGNLQKDK